jgi:hypothetical protein
MDDDNDGILDWLDIDPDCDLDNDADLHGAKQGSDGLRARMVAEWTYDTRRRMRDRSP